MYCKLFVAYKLSLFSCIVQYADGDPLDVTDEEMELGYTFALKPSPSKQSAPRRKSASSKSASQSMTALDESMSSKHETEKAKMKIFI